MTPSLAGRDALRMNGAGNAIVVLDLRGAAVAVTPRDARAIGAAPGLRFDQLMAVYDPLDPAHDARMEIYNIDGSRAESCGNGTRCVASALAAKGVGADGAMTLESDAGLLDVRREADGRFTVDMGAPRLGWRDIPLSREADTTSVLLDPPVAGAPAAFSAVGMGNPHAVFFVADAQAVDLAAVGPQVERHPLFPARVNASFAQMIARDRIVLRVWERGAGATLACGTAACATLAAAVRAGLADREATVALPGGELRIAWHESDGHILMTGPVEHEFSRSLDAAIFEGAA